MALSADVIRITRGDNRTDVTSMEGTVDVFYKGAYVAIDTATGLVVVHGDVATYHWLGMVREQVTADGTDAAPVKIQLGGFTLVKVAVAGVDNQNDVGDLVYASDDGTLTLTATANTKPIGYVEWYYGSSTTCDVRTFTPGESRAL